VSMMIIGESFVGTGMNAARAPFNPFFELT
jgi:hypothetical protein